MVRYFLAPLLIAPAIAGCWSSYDRVYDPDGTTVDTLVDTVTDTGVADVPVDLPEIDISPPDAVCEEPVGPASPTLHHPAPEGASDVTVATDGCDRVYAAWQQGWEISMIVSTDGGATFDPPALIAHGWKPYLLVDEARRAHIVYLDDVGFMAYRNLSTGDDPVRLSAEADAAIHGMEPVVHRVADTRGPSEVAAVWRSSGPGDVWFATNASGEWTRTRLIDHGFAFTVRMCLAGESRAVVMWKEAVDIGEDHGVFAALSEDRGDTFEVEMLDTGLDNGSSSLDLVCASDGRVLATWIRHDLRVQVATLDPTGSWHEGDTIFTAASQPFYPHVSLSGDRALVHWFTDFGTSFDLAGFDLEGRLVWGPVVGPDFGGDGHVDRILRSCAVGEGQFGLLTQDRHTMGPGMLVRLDTEGALQEATELGPWNTASVDTDLACDGWGRAVAAWSGHAVEASVSVVSP